MPAKVTGLRAAGKAWRVARAAPCATARREHQDHEQPGRDSVPRSHHPAHDGGAGSHQCLARG